MRISDWSSVVCSSDLLQKLAPAVYAMDTTHILISVDNGNMADDRFHPLVDRCKDEDMAAGIGNAPGPDLVGVDRRVALEEADGVLIIPDLRPGIQMLAIVAATDPEVDRKSTRLNSSH